MLVVPLLELEVIYRGEKLMIAAGCFVMTKIIMSDTNSLRENSTQNTFLSLMFAVAYSIGPVSLFRSRLITGSWWCADFCFLEVVFWD